MYNRVSEVVYSTTNIIELECFLNDNGWDGKHKETGEDLANGNVRVRIIFSGS